MTKTAANTIDMTKGPLVGPLVRFILPLIGGSVFQQLYNTVDFLFVGNFLDRTAAAAVGASATLITITTDTIILLWRLSLTHSQGANSDIITHTQTFPMQGSLCPSPYHMPEAFHQRHTQHTLSSPHLLPACPLEWGAIPLDPEGRDHNSGCRSREM